MLMLSRKRHEKIIVGDDVVISVAEIKPDRVKIGITAPIEITVHRDEVYDAIKRNNLELPRAVRRDLAVRECRRLESKLAEAMERLATFDRPGGAAVIGGTTR